MSKPRKIHGANDVAKKLGISISNMSNLLVRHDDIPKPQYVTPNGRMYWTDAGVKAWQDWREKMINA